MPIRVQVPGHGIVEFPDGTPEQEMAAALSSLGEPAAPAKADPFAAVAASEKARTDSGKRMLGAALEQLNPLAAAQSFGRMVIPEAAARLMGAGDQEAKQYGPVNTIVNPMRQTFDAAKAAYDKGDYGSAAIKAVFSGVPLVGPALAQMGDQMGTDPERAIGGAVGMVAGLALPKVVGTVKANLPKMLPGAASAEDAAAVEFGRSRGVPVDAGTATGNRFVKSVQGLADHSPVGSVIAERAKAAQGEALRRVGGEIASDVRPGAVGPVEAGESVAGALEGKIRKSHAAANDAYGRLRQLEAGSPDEVVPVKSEAVSADPKVLDRAFVLRWLADDLKEMPFQKSSRMKGIHAVDEMEAATSQEAGRRATYSPRVAGSPVQDTLNLGGVGGTKAELAARIEKALQSGKVDGKLAKIADAYGEAWDGERFDFDLVNDQTLADAGLMRRAMKSPITMPDVTAPGARRFFPDSSAPEVPKPVSEATQKLAVDIRGEKSALRPIYERLMREAEIAPPQGGKARATQALDRLMNGPDFAPLSELDSAVGDLKALARNGDMPELRSQGQGIAAEAVKRLDAKLLDRAAKAGPDVLSALQEGRQATVAKYVTAEARDLIAPGVEPGQVFSRLTANGDAGVTKLRTLIKEAPEQAPIVARAVIDHLLDKPTSESGFKFADKAQADWQKLGPETKRLLFKPSQVADLDRFFLLAKRIGESPNPSQSGLVINAGGQLALALTNPATGVPVIAGSGALSAILHNPTAVKFLTNGLRMQINATPAAQAAALGQFAKAADAAGVVIPFPKAADATPEEKR